MPSGMRERVPKRGGIQSCPAGVYLALVSRGPRYGTDVSSPDSSRLSGGSHHGVQLLGQLDVADVFPGMSVVADEPREPGAPLIVRERRKAQTGSQAITVDPRSY